MPLRRYPTDNRINTDHDVFKALVGWLGFLASKEYLVELLKNVHGLSKQQSKTRAIKIIPHIKLANGYIKQCQNDSDDLSFLPAYYAILNLMKVYILLGTHYDQLDANRWHGVVYDMSAKEKKSIISEEIILKMNGVFPLFYKSITGNTIEKITTIRLKDVIGLVTGVSAEYEMATGKITPLFGITEQNVLFKGETRTVFKISDRDGNVPEISIRNIQAFKNFSTFGGTKNTFICKSKQMGEDWATATLRQFPKYLIYKHPFATVIGVSAAPIELPEELPTALLFFYMSTIVRYKPEFLYTLKDSKYWPYLTGARTDAFYNFLLNFWSHIHKENYLLNAQEI